MADEETAAERRAVLTTAETGEGIQNPAPTPEQLAERERQVRERAAAEGATTPGGGSVIDETGQHDYFGFDETYTVTLPDGRSYVEHQLMNEGARRKYLNKVNREVHLSRQSGDARINTAPGDERKALFDATLCGWNLVRNGKPVPFNDSNKRAFLENADPKVIDLIEKDIRLKNPWLLNEMSVEDIDREIASLEEMRAAKVKEEESKNA